MFKEGQVHEDVVDGAAGGLRGMEEHQGLRVWRCFHSTLLLCIGSGVFRSFWWGVCSILQVAKRHCACDIITVDAYGLVLKLDVRFVGIVINPNTIQLKDFSSSLKYLTYLQNVEYALGINEKDSWGCFPQMESWNLLEKLFVIIFKKETGKIDREISSESPQKTDGVGGRAGIQCLLDGACSQLSHWFSAGPASSAYRLWRRERHAWWFGDKQPY